MMDTLTTERLILKPLEPADAGFIQRLFPHEDIVKFIGFVPWPYPADGAEKFVAMKLREMAEGKVWYWSIRLRSQPDEGIGCIEYAAKKEPAHSAHRGFWLGLPYHGHGYMTEAVQATLAYIFNQTPITTLLVENRIGNTASRRVKEKTGTTYIGMGSGKYIDGEHPQERWELTKDQWLKAQKR